MMMIVVQCLVAFLQYKTKKTFCRWHIPDKGPLNLPQSGWCLVDVN